MKTIQRLFGGLLVAGIAAVAVVASAQAQVTKDDGKCHLQERVKQEVDIGESLPTFEYQLRFQHFEVRQLLRPGPRRSERQTGCEPFTPHGAVVFETDHIEVDNTIRCLRIAW